jgi:peroxiredoxin
MHADDGRVAHLARGLRLPSLALSSTVGDTIDPSRLRGRSVIFCYPWTGRPGLPNPPNWDNIAGAHGSTPQAAGFRDRHAEFRQSGVEVLGLSTQNTPYQRELATRLRLPFALLSDCDFAFLKALRLPVFETGGVTYLTRLTLIVREGAIEDVLYPVDPPEASAAATLARLVLS